MARAVLWLPGTIALAMLAVHWAQLGAARDDGVATIVDLYRASRASLPDSGYVAFVGTSPDPTDAARVRFIAQYALTPLVLVDSATMAPAAVTGPAAPQSVDRVMEAAGLSLVAVAPGGVRVYRR